MDDKDGYNSVEYIKEKYNRTQDYPFYMEMINKGTKVIGVWDDHDYGLNNGDKNFPLKNEVRDIFLDFINES
jgi:alkaline phosphatase D